MASVLIEIQGDASGFHTGYGQVLQAWDKDGNEVEAITFLRDGMAVLRPEDRETYTAAHGQVSFDVDEQPKIAWPDYHDGRGEPTDTYPVAVNLANCYIPPAPPPAPNPAELRRQAYETERLIQWPEDSGELLTVTEAAEQWQYYAAEGDHETAVRLTTLIAAAKTAIRERSAG